MLPAASVARTTTLWTPADAKAGRVAVTVSVAPPNVPSAADIGIEVVPPSREHEAETMPLLTAPGSATTAVTAIAVFTGAGFGADAREAATGGVASTLTVKVEVAALRASSVAVTVTV